MLFVLPTAMMALGTTLTPLVCLCILTLRAAGSVTPLTAAAVVVQEEDKTTTAVNLGAYLSTVGLKILIVDADPQSNATSSLGLVGGEGNASLVQA